MRAAGGLALVWLIACGRDVDLGSDPDDETTFEEAVRRLAEAHCEGNLRCCDELEQTYPDLETCVERESREVMEIGVAAFEDGRIVLDDDAVDALVDEMSSDASVCATPDHFSGLPLRGTVEVGEDCSATASDPSPLFSCAPGSYCAAVSNLDGSATGTCQPRGSAGEACVEASFFGGPCEEGLYCSAVNDGDRGTCQPERETGEPCEHSDECAGGYCDDCPGGPCDNPDVCAGSEGPDPETYYCFGER